MSNRAVIHASDAPKAIGLDSQAVKTNNVVYLSGQIGIDPATNQVVEGGTEAQTKRVMENLGAVLKEAGLIRGEIDGPRTCYCLEPRTLRRLKALIGGL